MTRCRLSKEELIEQIDKLDKQIEENRSALKALKECETKIELLTGMLIANKQIMEKELKNL